MSQDLWPDDIAKVDFIPPIKILKDQASSLSQKTKGLIEGEVTTSAQGKQFTHVFMLIAPSLNNYRYGLFSILHDIALYPITASFQSMAYTLPDEKSFIEWLRKILNSTETRRIIQGILAQIQDTES